MDAGVGVTIGNPLHLTEGIEPEFTFNLNTTEPIMYDTYYEGWYYYRIYIR